MAWMWVATQHNTEPSPTKHTAAMEDGLPIRSSLFDQRSVGEQEKQRKSLQELLRETTQQQT